MDETEAEESLSLYDALDDEAFDAIVAKWYDKKKKKDDDKKEDKEAEASEATEVEETKKLKLMSKLLRKSLTK